MAARKYILIFLIAICLGCATKYNLQSNQQTLDFSDCLLDEKSYKFIELRIPVKSKKEKIEKHGFCEYRFAIGKKSKLYVTTDIYSGSRLNYENLYELGVDTYAISRSENLTDTIKNSGVNNGLYWLEYVLGDMTIGYVNVPEKDKAMFDNIISSINRSK